MSMYTALVTLQLLSAIVSFIGVIIVAFSKPSQLQKLLLLVAVTVFMPSIGYYFQMQSTDIESSLISIKIQYLGNCFSNIMFIAFVMKYCKVRIPKKTIAPVVIFNMFILMLIMTCEKHGLYYSEIGFTQEGLFPHIKLGHGPFYYVYIVEVVLTDILMCLVVVYHLIKAKKEERKRLFVIAIAGMMPVVGLTLLYSGVCNGYDPTPISLLFAVLVMIYSIYRYNLFDVMTNAKDNIIENISEGIIVVDPEKKFVYSNTAAMGIFPELLRLKEYSDFDEMPKTVQMIFTSAKNYKFRLNERFYEANVNEIYDKKFLQGYALIIRDETENQEYTEKLIELKNNADVANKAKSDFLANMSHEIRTPMNSILGMTDIIIRDTKEEKILESAANIKTSGKSLLAIINDILDFSKIESGKMTLVNDEYSISKAIRDLENITKIKLEPKGLAFRVNISEAVPDRLIGDEIRVKQIFLNLINNAVKFTEKGSITVDIDFVYGKNNQGMLKADIIDTGCGIKREDLEVLFESFSRVETKKNRQIEGTGLGLAICKNFTEMMNGNIGVKSEYGIGSNFYFSIEQGYLNKEIKAKEKYDELDNVIFIDEEKISSIIMPDARLLIVDDNKVNIMVLQGLLEPYKAQIDYALSGKEALEKIEQKEYDLIYMDQMMPEMDGVETLHSLRQMKQEYCKTVPVVVVTANVVGEAQTQLINEGFSHYISKPITVKELDESLKDYIPKEKIIYDSQKDDENTEPAKSDIIQESHIQREQEDVLPFTIKGADVKKGLEYSNNVTENYIKILRTVCKEYDERNNALEKYFNEEDWKNYTILVHGLKSVAASIGADDFSNHAKEHEMAGKEERYEYIKQDFMALKEEYKILTDNILAALPYEEEKEEPVTITDRKLEIRDIDKVIEVISEFDVNKALEYLNEYMGYNITQSQRSCIKKAMEHIEDMSFFEAADVLNTIKSDWNKK